jgi:tetratricopeptide (TPR) repeat protein
MRGSIREGRRRVEQALGRADEQPSLARANALTGALDLAIDDGDLTSARLWGEEALVLHRALGNGWGVAYVQMALASVFNYEDRFAEAQPLFAESAEGFRALGDEHRELQATWRLAWTYEALGDLQRARELQADNLRLARARGDASTEAISLAMLAQYDLDEGRVEPAIPLLEEAHRIWRDRPSSPDRYWYAVLLCRFARALAQKGEPAAAIRLLACADARFEELEIGESNAEPWLVRMNEETREMVRPLIEEPVAAKANEDGWKLTVDEAVTLALVTLRSRWSAERPLPDSTATAPLDGGRLSSALIVSAGGRLTSGLAEVRLRAHVSLDRCFKPSKREAPGGSLCTRRIEELSAELTSPEARRSELAGRLVVIGPCVWSGVEEVILWRVGHGNPDSPSSPRRSGPGDHCLRADLHGLQRAP